MRIEDTSGSAQAVFGYGLETTIECAAHPANRPEPDNDAPETHAIQPYVDVFAGSTRFGRELQRHLAMARRTTPWAAGLAARPILRPATGSRSRTHRLPGISVVRSRACSSIPVIELRGAGLSSGGSSRRFEPLPPSLSGRREVGGCTTDQRDQRGRFGRINRAAVCAPAMTSWEKRTNDPHRDSTRDRMRDRRAHRQLLCCGNAAQRLMGCCLCLKQV